MANDRDCENCKHYKEVRCKNGTFYHSCESWDCGFEPKEDEPFEHCEDCIRRQAVLDTLENMDRALDEDRTVENYKELLRECYKVLPPVNPQKTICPSMGIDCEDCPAYEGEIVKYQKIKQMLYEFKEMSLAPCFMKGHICAVHEILNEVIGPSASSLEKPNKWIPIKTRPLTNKEKEEYADFGYSEDSIDSMYDCPLPEDGEEVLIITRYDEVTIDTFYRDEGCYFETYCDKDDVKAWMPLPKPYKAEGSGEE